MQKTRNLLLYVTPVLLFIYIYVLRAMPGGIMPHLITQLQIPSKDIPPIFTTYVQTSLMVLFSAGLLIDIFKPRVNIIFAILLAMIGTYILGSAKGTESLLHSLGLIGISLAFFLVGIWKILATTIPRRFLALTAGLLLGLGEVILNFGSGLIKWNTGINDLQNTASIINVFAFICLIITALSFFIKKTDDEKQNISVDGILTIIKDYRIWLLGVIAATGFIFFGIFSHLFGGAYLKQIFKFSTLDQAENLISWSIYGFALGSLVTGIIASITQGRRSLLIPGYIIAALLFLIVLYVPNLSYGAVASLLFFIGFFSSVQLICYVLIVDFTQPSNTGFAFALFFLVSQYLGMFLSPLGGKLLIQPSGINWHGFILIPIVMAIGSLLAIALHKKPTLIKKTNDITKNIGNELIQYWKGEKGLGRAYWLVYQLGNSIIPILGSAFLISFHYQPKQFLSLLILPSLIFSTVIVWRCANNTTWWRGWKYIARTIIIINLIYIIVLFIGELLMLIVRLYN